MCLSQSDGGEVTAPPNSDICICNVQGGVGSRPLPPECTYERASSFITRERSSNKSPTVVGDLIASAPAEISPGVPGLLFSSSTYTRVKD